MMLSAVTDPDGVRARRARRLQRRVYRTKQWRSYGGACWGHVPHQNLATGLTFDHDSS